MRLKLVALGIISHAVMVCIFASEAAEPANLPTFLQKPANRSGVRVMSWNVWHSSIFPPDGARREAFARIARAVQPDVICFQEVIPSYAAQVPALLDRLMPLGDSRRWSIHYGTNGDNVVASRYPLKSLAKQDVVPLGSPRFPTFCLGHVMCLVDLPDARAESDMYLVAAHFRSRSGEANQTQRQKQADSLIRWLRQLRDRNNPDSIPQGTPIVIVGDLNVLDSDPNDALHHLTTLLTGNIVDEQTFGPDLKPDWDGSNLVEVKPRHNAREKDYYTWRVDSEPYPPGALDRILYTDSVMTAANSFVLNTTIMTQLELEQSGLQRADVLKEGKDGNFDHLPLVVDFVFRSPEPPR